MDNQNGTNVYAWKQHYIGIHKGYAVIPSLLLFLILVNNIFIILTFKQVKKKQFTDAFMCALAIADLAMFIPITVTVVTFLHGSIIMNGIVCDIWALNTGAGVSTTALLHCAICIEKCVSIWKPLEHKLFVTRKYSYYVLYAVVIACFIIPVSYCSILIRFGVLPHVNFDPVKVICIPEFDIPFFLTVGIPFLVCPLVVEVLTNILILIKVRKLRGARRQQQLRAVTTVLLTVGVYYLCTCPTGVYMVCSAVYEIPPIFKFVVHYMIISNSIVNFWIYLGCLPRFQEAFKTLLQLNQSINRVAPS